MHEVFSLPEIFAVVICLCFLESAMALCSDMKRSLKKSEVLHRYADALMDVLVAWEAS